MEVCRHGGQGQGVCYSWYSGKVTFSSKVVAEVPITGIVTTSGENKTIPYTRGDGDKRINSTQQLTLTIQYTGWQSSNCVQLCIFHSSELWYNKTANYTAPTKASLVLNITTEGENRAWVENIEKGKTLLLQGLLEPDFRNTEPEGVIQQIHCLSYVYWCHS